MLRHLPLVCMSTVWLLATLAAQAAEPDAGKIDRLIKQLGSEKFSAREAASKQLEQIGERALKSLQGAARSSDAEVRRRAAGLVQAIGSQETERAIATLQRLGGTVVRGEGAKEAGEEGILLYLQGSQVTDGDLALLKKIPDVRLLCLSGLPISDAGLAHLQGLTHLRKLDLGLTQVSDKGLTSLKKLNRLEGLQLAATKVTDKGILGVHATPGAVSQVALSN